MLWVVLVSGKGLSALPGPTDDEYKKAAEGDPEQKNERQQDKNPSVHPLSH